MTYVAVGDTTASAGACAAYAMDLAKWTAEQKAYSAALAARAAAMASAQAQYQKAMSAYNSALAGQASGYAMATSAVLKKYPNIKLPAGAPACVSSDAHKTAASDCYIRQSAIRGLGAYDWTPLDSCFVAALPVCQALPVKPVAPAPLPLPTPLRAKPTAPSGCTSGASSSSTPTPSSAAATATAVPAPIAPAPSPAPFDMPQPLVEASLSPEAKSSTGLLFVVVAGVALGGYLLLRRKPRP